MLAPTSPDAPYPALETVDELREWTDLLKELGSPFVLQLEHNFDGGHPQTLPGRRYGKHFAVGWKLWCNLRSDIRNDHYAHG